MKNIIDCPYCDGNATLRHQVQEMQYKKESFTVHAHYYACNSCKEEFTTTATDELTMTQLFNLYRERHRIPFPFEIAQIREQYGLSATAMSEVLGLGVNGYGLYEKGEMPTTAIGNLIISAKDPWTFKHLLESVMADEAKSSYKKALQHAEILIEKNRAAKPFYTKIDVISKPNSYTGFRIPNLDVISAMISSFIARCNPILNDRLKLNKLMFYADFTAFKMSGYSISGLSYRAIQYGPVPSCYDNLFALLENESIIFSDWQLEDGNPRELFFTHAKPNSDMLSAFENDIVGNICTRFAETPSWNLVELSHQEKGWTEAKKDRGLISYQEYAFDLREINFV